MVQNVGDGDLVQSLRAADGPVTSTDVLRNCLWTKLFQERVKHGETRIVFNWETALAAVSGEFDSVQQSQLQGAIEHWNESGIRVNWIGERNGSFRSVQYVITIDRDRLEPGRAE